MCDLKEGNVVTKNFDIPYSIIQNRNWIKNMYIVITK